MSKKTNKKIKRYKEIKNNDNYDVDNEEFYHNIEENNKKINKDIFKNKYFLLLFFVLLIILFIVVLNSSYSFFVSEANSKVVKYTSATVSVDFVKNGNVINNASMSPTVDSTAINQTGYLFNVKNNGTIESNYQVRLELLDSITNQINSNYIKYAYKKNNGNISKIYRLSDTNNMIIIPNTTIQSNDTDIYDLKIWLDIDTPVTESNKEFSAQIIIDGLQTGSSDYSN